MGVFVICTLFVGAFMMVGGSTSYSNPEPIFSKDLETSKKRSVLFGAIGLVILVISCLSYWLFIHNG